MNSVSHQHQQQQVIIPITPPLNLPCADLLSGSREDYIEICVPLYKASANGDWKSAKVILDKRPELVRFSITEKCDTPLHIAASAKSTTLVRNLVNLMENKDLELQNVDHNTALNLAAAAGKVEIAEIIVSKNMALLTIPGNQGMVPLRMAAFFGKHNTVKYLYDKSQKMTGDTFWTHESRGCVLLKCVEADLFDVALQIVEDHPGLAMSRTILGVLARKPDAFRQSLSMLRGIKSIFAMVRGVRKESDAMQLLRIIWKSIVKLPKDEFDDIMRGPHDPIKEDGKLTYSSQILFVATEMDNTRFVAELIGQYPDLACKVNDNKQSIFHVAVSHRCPSIFNLLYKIGSQKDSITTLEDENGNNMLHLVAKTTSKNRIEDKAVVLLQLHREVEWFMEVKSVIPPCYQEKKNADGVTPKELFTNNIKDLASKEERWMKGTAAQLMVVAALIATVAFEATFTIPGGFNQNNGIPLFLPEESFTIFIISDALAFIFASISILLLLVILIFPYTVDAFERLAPLMMASIATLFLSITIMMLTFNINLFLLYRKNSKWVPAIITVFATYPFVVPFSIAFLFLLLIYRFITLLRNKRRSAKP